MSTQGTIYTNLHYFTIEGSNIVRQNQISFTEKAQPDTFLSMKNGKNGYSIIGCNQGLIGITSSKIEEKNFIYLPNYKKNIHSIQKLYDMGKGRFLSKDNGGTIKCWDVEKKISLSTFELSSISKKYDIYSDLFLISETQFELFLGVTKVLLEVKLRVVRCSCLILTKRILII